METFLGIATLVCFVVICCMLYLDLREPEKRIDMEREQIELYQEYCCGSMGDFIPAKENAIRVSIYDGFMVIRGFSLAILKTDDIDSLEWSDLV